MINLENNNLNYFIGDPENSDVESYMAMPEEGEDVTTKETDDTQSEDTTIEETSEDVKVEEIEVETDNTSKTTTEEPEVESVEEKNLDEPSEEVSDESDTVKEVAETEDTAKAATEEAEVESVEDKEEKNLDEPSEEVSDESDTVEEVAETEDSPTPIEMDPAAAAHLSMQTKIVQATYSDIRKDLPQFHSGDTISVGYRVIEGSRSRVQIFEGVVIKISAGHGLDKTFTVRKISGGIGVERIFPFHSPNIKSVKVLKEGKVRRAKLYYLRGLKGKATRIKDRIK